VLPVLPVLLVSLEPPAQELALAALTSCHLALA
jgi:hypothetical protein